MHYKNINLGFVYSSVAGIFFGLILSYPLHRIIIVFNTKPEPQKVPLSGIPKIGKMFMSLYGIALLVGIIGIHSAGDYSLQKYYPIYTVKNKKVDASSTPLHCAASRKDIGIIKLAFEKYNDINARNWRGKTAIHIAASRGYANVVMFFIGKGADVDLPDNFGMTPLHCMAQNGKRVIASILISNGAEISAIDNKGKTPLHYAASNGNPNTALLLIKNGANINATDYHGNTILDCAVNGNRDNLAALLISRGAKAGSELRKESMSD